MFWPSIFLSPPPLVPAHTVPAGYSSRHFTLDSRPAPWKIWTNLPSRYFVSPCSVPIQTVLAESTNRARTIGSGRSCGPPMALNLPLRSRTSPAPTVPIHSVPSALEANAPMRSSGKPGLLAALKTVKLEPSNRASPPKVANHKYPSGVRAMARTESCGRPLLLFQTSCPYWVMASLGSNPQHAEAIENANPSRQPRTWVQSSSYSDRPARGFR